MARSRRLDPGAQRGLRSRRHDAARRADLLRQGRHAREERSTAPSEISERHRHRYEFNNRYFDQLVRSRPRCSRASRATGSSSSSSCRLRSTRGSSPRSSTRSSRRIRATATRCSRASSPRRARVKGSSCRESRAHEARGLRGRLEVPAVPDRRPVRHRERGARDEHGRAAQDDHGEARDAVRLQGVVRQGQSQLARQLPRPRRRARPAHTRARARRSSACPC